MSYPCPNSQYQTTKINIQLIPIRQHQFIFQLQFIIINSNDNYFLRQTNQEMDHSLETIPHHHSPLDSDEEKIHNISQDKQRYKRSTNNSHKKFIGLAKKLFFKHCNHNQRLQFQHQFELFKNSRTYFFIILAHVKLRLNTSFIFTFREAYLQLLTQKIELYQIEIGKTDNINFMNFRADQVADLRFAIKAFQLYFEGKVEESIQTLYKKQKRSVLKIHQYQSALFAVEQLQRILNISSNQDIVGHLNNPQTLLQLQKMKKQFLLLKYNTKKQMTQKQHHEVVKVKQIWDQSSEYRIQEDRECHRRRKNKRYQLKRYQKKIQKRKIKSQQLQNPLLYLQNSYPLFDYFFKVIYPYETNQQTPIISQNIEIDHLFPKINLSELYCNNLGDNQFNGFLQLENNTFLGCKSAQQMNDSSNMNNLPTHFLLRSKQQKERIENQLNKQTIHQSSSSQQNEYKSIPVIIPAYYSKMLQQFQQPSALLHEKTILKRLKPTDAISNSQQQEICQSN